MAFQSSYLSEDGVLLNLTWNDTSPVGYSATKAAPSLYQWDDAAWVMSACFIIFGKGPFTNYITHFLPFFDHPPTHGNVFAITLLMIYHTKVCNSNAFADHPPTSVALRNL